MKFNEPRDATEQARPASVFRVFVGRIALARRGYRKEAGPSTACSGRFGGSVPDAAGTL